MFVDAMRCVKVPRMSGRAVLVLGVLLASAATAAPPARAAGPAAPCTGDPSLVRRLDLVVGGQTTYGTYVLPAARPRGLVVFGHGYTFNVDAWRDHMRRAAARDGLVAVTMNYRGLTDKPRDETGYERSRGFPVKPGGEDLVAAARHLQRVCGGFDRRLLLGVSMGGNASGLAAAMRGKTDDGRPIFDYWIGVEGVYNLTETYNAARAVGAAEPVADIEKETGGPIEREPAAFAERTVVNRTADIAASGLKGIALVHGVNDGLVPYNQSAEFARAMRRTVVPVDFYSATRKAPGDQADDTRILPTDAPGHASEHARHVVIDTGLDLVSAFARGDRPPPCNRDFTVDGTASPQIAPDPNTPASGCPARPSFHGSPGGGGGSSAGGGTGCTGARAPSLSLRATRSGRRGLLVRGRARGCAAALRRVRVAVARVGASGRRCRFVTRPRSGRLTRPRSCARNRVFLRPRGTQRFRLAVRRLPRGRYRVIAVATDLAGNRRRASRTLRTRR